MMNSNEIIKKENSNDNLNKLYAQRQIYSDDKNIFGIEILLATILPVILSFLSNYAGDYFNLNFNLSKEAFKALIGFTSILISILDLTLIPYILNKNKSLAASIQDSFDCNVLSLQSNPIKITKPDNEIIFKYSEKFKKKNTQEEIDNMKNWYYSSNLNKIELKVATILCQRTNCWWDNILRKKFLIFLYAIATPIFLIVIVISLINEVTLTSLTVNAILPFSCLIVFLIKQHTQHKSSIKMSEKLQKHSEDIWARVLAKNINDIELKDLSRKLQDEIYQNRSTSPLIFDWFYKKYKIQQEGEVHYNLDTMIDEYTAIYN